MMSPMTTCTQSGRLSPAVWTSATLHNSARLRYSLSSRGGLNHGGVANNICWRAPPGLNLFAQKCHRVLAGRAPGGVAPLWEQFIVIGALWSVGLQDAQEHFPENGWAGRAVNFLHRSGRGALGTRPAG